MADNAGPGSTTARSDDDSKAGLAENTPVEEPKSLWGVIFAVAKPILAAVGPNIALAIICFGMLGWYVSQNYGIPMRDSHVKSQERISTAMEDMAKTTAAQAETLRNISSNEATQLEIQHSQNKQLSEIIINQGKQLDNHRVMIENQLEFHRAHQTALKLIERINDKAFENGGGG